MDGVLVDAKDWHYLALNEALSLFGLEINKYDHLTTYDGLPTKKKLIMLSKESGLPEGLHNLINDIKQMETLKLGYKLCRPSFAHQYALNNLKRMGYKLAVCSNSKKKTIELFLERVALKNYLDFYISNEDVIKPKPSPEMYTMAINKLSLRPDQCLILEDNEHGIQAAIDSGSHVMVINDVHEVNLRNILNKISMIEGGQ